MATKLEAKALVSGSVRSIRELTADQLAFAGGKGGSLSRLHQAGFPVPDGFVIPPSAFADDGLTPDAWTQVRAHLSRMRAANRDVAFVVRSSALAEDSVEASFAGEFESVLNVRTDEEIRQAITTVRRSRSNERVLAYTQAKGIRAAHEVAVVVQTLVRAERSGVLFTANPVTGSRDHALISAAWGLGEAVVGGLVTPDALTVEKSTGRILKRQTADKRVMTVLGESGTHEQPVPKPLRRVPVLTDELAAKLVRLGIRIEAFIGMPMDIEWTLADGEFAIVQARPITALPEPEPTAAIEWKLPRGKYIAMRNNIVELMADPLTPLFGTMGLADVNTSMGRLMTEFFGRPGLTPEELIVTVNDYAYYNGSLTPGQMGQIFLRSIGIARRMSTGAVGRWLDVGRPKYSSTVEGWKAKPWRDFSNEEILAGARELAVAAVEAYVALVSGVIPAAWISEALFTITYNTLIRRRDDPPAPTFLLGFDSTPIRADKSLYDLAEWARGRTDLAAFLHNTPTPQLASQLENGGSPRGAEPADWREWRNRFRSHLQRFGHTIYNLDYANPVPADDPVPLLETFKLFLSGQGVNPHTRQQAAAERRKQATRAVLGRLKGPRRNLFRKLLAAAQRYAPLREDGLADVGLSYPLLRQMLLELGRRFVAGGMIEAPGEIFWLNQDEVERAAARQDRGEALSRMTSIAQNRKAAWRMAKRLTPPKALPQLGLPRAISKLFGARRARTPRGEFIRGVAASPGRVTAPASVLHGPEDFDKMNAGDVLVAPITTPAWTPLFARASGIVTDVGGPLSHGSIVAREYGIPAVLGTGEATKRILDGETITVDGTAGVVSRSEAQMPRDYP